MVGGFVVALSSSVDGPADDNAVRRPAMRRVIFILYNAFF